MFSYDQFPYESATTRTVHPDQIGTIAYLFGLDAAPVEHARVLEIGCGTGANLIPFAAEHPAAECIGIDLSAPAIAEGRACVEALGLGNVALRHESFAETPADIGTFDYVIANGVYTWVPIESRDDLVALCRDRLAPTGLAMLGYHTLPGWHFSGALRDMLRFSTDGIDDARERIAQARKHIAFVADAASRQPGFYAQHLRDGAERIARKDDTHFFHEYLGEDNHPVYFHQFMADAERHGLAYVWDAVPGTGFVDNFPPDVAAELHRHDDDRMVVEQWIDFLTNRRWRNSILCRRDTAPVPALDEERIAPCAVLSRLRPVSGGPAPQAGTARFRDPRGTEVAPGLPATVRALSLLAESWPRAMRFDELAARVAGAPGVADRASVADELKRNLLRMAFLGSISLMRAPLRVAGAIGARPTASAYARWQAPRRPYVLSGHHTTIALGDAERGLLALLDGTRDRIELDAEWRRLTGGPSQAEARSADAVLETFLDQAILIE